MKVKTDAQAAITTNKSLPISKTVLSECHTSQVTEKEFGRLIYLKGLKSKIWPMGQRMNPHLFLQVFYWNRAMRLYVLSLGNGI